MHRGKITKGHQAPQRRETHCLYRAPPPRTCDHRPAFHAAVRAQLTARIDAPNNNARPRQQMMPSLPSASISAISPASQRSQLPARSLSGRQAWRKQHMPGAQAVVIDTKAQTNETMTRLVEEGFRRKSANDALLQAVGTLGH